jgi:hypothetical protein
MSVPLKVAALNHSPSDVSSTQVRVRRGTSTIFDFQACSMAPRFAIQPRAEESAASPSRKAYRGLNLLLLPQNRQSRSATEQYTTRPDFSLSYSDPIMVRENSVRDVGRLYYWATHEILDRCLESDFRSWNCWLGEEGMQKPALTVEQYRQLHEMRREYNRFIFQAPSIMVAIIVGSVAVLFRGNTPPDLTNLSQALGFVVVLFPIGIFVLVLGY